MITHVVMMKFKPEVTADDIDALEALLDRLPDRIDEIESYDFGRDVHPDHQVVIKKLGSMCTHIAAVDYENAPYHQQSDGDLDPWKSRHLFQRS